MTVLPQNLDEGFGLFNAARRDLADASKVLEAAGRMDQLFSLPELVDIGQYLPEQPPTGGPSRLRSLQLDPAMIQNISSCGFASAVRRCGSQERAAYELGRLARDPFALCELFDQIRLGGDLPEFWVDPFLAAGRVPELRVYDLDMGMPVILTGPGGQHLWPSPFKGVLDNGFLAIQFRGLESFKGRTAHLGLFPIDSDKALTRRSLAEALVLGCDEELASMHRELWEKVQPEPEDWDAIRKDMDNWRKAPLNRTAWKDLVKSCPYAPTKNFRVQDRDINTITLGPDVMGASLSTQVLVLAFA